jgi:[NiFe] hydrogenase diaphorase moiety small subunit
MLGKQNLMSYFTSQLLLDIGELRSDDLEHDRKHITQMLVVEGNHFCPSCERIGNCQLQAVAYYLDMHDNHFPHFFANREMDASHPDILIDHNRCIFCNLCVRASQEKDNKNVFAISGRGINKRLIIPFMKL